MKHLDKMLYMSENAEVVYSMNDCSMNSEMIKFMEWVSVAGKLMVR